MQCHLQLGAEACKLDAVKQLPLLAEVLGHIAHLPATGAA